MKRTQRHHLDVLTVKGNAAIPTLAECIDEVLVGIPRDAVDDDARVGWKAIEPSSWRLLWLLGLGDGHGQSSLNRAATTIDRPPPATSRTTFARIQFAPSAEKQHQPLLASVIGERHQFYRNRVARTKAIPRTAFDGGRTFWSLRISHGAPKGPNISAQGDALGGR